MKDWQWKDEFPSELRITNVSCRIADGESILTWNWPGHVRFVYIYGFVAGMNMAAEELPLGMKLYTREEYKANAGYRERADRVGGYCYRVYPCVRTEHGTVVYRQEDSDNEVKFSMGKAVIRTLIKYSGGWLSKRRTAQITVHTEIPVPKDALCYVIQEGSPPLTKDKGTVYPLISDLQPGVNRLPDIEIGKNDYVKLFFTNGRTYGETFDLIHG